LIRLTEIIELSARAALRLQGRDGAMPAGHNGPWHDPETPVRATAHWALVFYEAYSRSRRQGFLDAAIRACDYLIAKENRPSGATFACRLPKEGKTRCNGLIGQAWAVEPLILIGGALQAPEYLRVAENVLSLHPYDRRGHGWRVVEFDGQIKGVDRTYNHQVWFCAMTWLFERIHGDRNSALSAAARDFSMRLGRMTRLTNRSYFAHVALRSPVARLRDAATWLLTGGHRRRLGPVFPQDYLSVGYHSFVLYGLGLMRDHLPIGEGPIPTGLGEMIGRGIGIAGGHLWRLSPDENVFAFGYNPTGIEMAYALVMFPDLAPGDAASGPGAEEWLARQVANHFDSSTGLMDRAAPDPIALAARIYEAIRLPDWEIRAGT